jgi:hypothetical protein
MRRLFNQEQQNQSNERDRQTNTNDNNASQVTQSGGAGQPQAESQDATTPQVGGQDSSDVGGGNLPPAPESPQSPA